MFAIFGIHCHSFGLFKVETHHQRRRLNRLLLYIMATDLISGSTLCYSYMGSVAHTHAVHSNNSHQNEQCNETKELKRINFMDTHEMCVFRMSHHRNAKAHKTLLDCVCVMHYVWIEMHWMHFPGDGNPIKRIEDENGSERERESEQLKANTPKTHLAALTDSKTKTFVLFPGRMCQQNTGHLSFSLSLSLAHAIARITMDAVDQRHTHMWNGQIHSKYLKEEREQHQRKRIS